MTDLLTAAQMRAIEDAAITSGATTGLELMERAGQGAVDAVFAEWPELAQGDHAAVVLCGPGNNGGDGFVVARLLAERGWDVEVFLYGDAARLPQDAKTNCDRWAALGAISPLTKDCLFRSRANVGGKDILVVDALFGTGLKRPLSDDLCRVLNSAATTDRFAFARRVSLDIPSGLCADSGRYLRPILPCGSERALTVTFHTPKRGQYLGEHSDLIGTLKTVSIGIEEQASRYLAALPETDFAAWLIEGPDWDVFKFGRHKYDHGHALILAGRPGQTGAARLAARAALRIGAGLVTLGIPNAAWQEAASQVTAVMARPVDSAEDLDGVLRDPRINAVCIGPGLGIERARAFFEVAVRAEHAPYIALDADALTAFAGAPAEMFEQLHDRCILTPHGGEFARLFPDIAARLAERATTGPAYSKVDATRDAAARAGATVLYKGADTVIAGPDGRCSVNAAFYDRTAPWLATAGSGDVLAGFITGLLARRFDVHHAAETAAWLHTECALSFGPGLIAEDLADELPKVLRHLGI